MISSAALFRSDYHIRGRGSKKAKQNSTTNVFERNQPANDGWLGNMGESCTHSTTESSSYVNTERERSSCKHIVLLLPVRWEKRLSIPVYSIEFFLFSFFVCSTCFGWFLQKWNVCALPFSPTSNGRRRAESEEESQLCCVQNQTDTKTCNCMPTQTVSVGQQGE